MIIERQQNLSSDKIYWGKIIADLLIFLIFPPIVGLPYIIIKTIQLNKNARYSDYLSFMICLAFYFGAINATKEPDGDQIQYYVAYMNVPKQGFLGSLINIYGIQQSWEDVRTNISGEFMNGVYNYIGYYSTFGYYPLFAALITIANYIFNFLAIYKIANTLKKPHIPIIFGTLILSFFYLYFQYILQIQKQFLAQSMTMYVLASYAVSGRLKKKDWCLMIMAVFTHASTLLFVPLILYKPLRNRLNKRSILFLCVVFSALIVMGPSLVGNIASDVETSVLTYGVNRFANSEGSSDGGTLVLSQILVIGLPIALIVLKKLWIDRKYVNVIQAFILNVILLLLLTVASMYNQPLAQYRYFMMIIAFMPHAYFFISNSVKARDCILKIIAFVMIVWFYYQFEKIIWNFAPETDIIIKSPILLLFGNYY